MDWLTTLNNYLRIRPKGPRGEIVTCAVVEQTPIPRGTPASWSTSTWSIEERRTPRGNIALHLFPSGA